MHFLIIHLLHYLSQLSLAIIPVYLAYWLHQRK